MRWNLTQTTGQFNRWKLDQNESAELKYNKESHSFRVTATDKRLFFIDQTGFFQNKFLVKTEYSLIAAEILPRRLHSGIVFFENKKYHYHLSENSITVLRSKDDFSLFVEIDAAENLEPTQLYALMFTTLRVAVVQPVLA